jgi:hypothetical protein
MIDPVKASLTVQRVLNFLVRGDYWAVDRITDGQRLSASDIEHAIAEYGRRLVHPPLDGLLRSVVEIEGSSPTRWSVYVDLWTAEEGRSDLTMELTLSDSSGEMYDVEIDNIHVL